MSLGAFLFGYDYGLTRSLSKYYYSYFDMWVGSSAVSNLVILEILGSFIGALVMMYVLTHLKIHLKLIYLLFLVLYLISVIGILATGSAYGFCLMRFLARFSSSGLFVSGLFGTIVLYKTVLKSKTKQVLSKCIVVLGSVCFGQFLATFISRLLIIFSTNSVLYNYGWKISFLLLVLLVPSLILIVLFSPNCSKRQIVNLLEEDVYKRGIPGLSVYRKILILSFIILVLGYFSGQNVIFYSVPDIFINLNWDENFDNIVAITIWFTYFLSAIFMYFAINKIDIRKIQLFMITLTMLVLILDIFVQIIHLRFQGNSIVLEIIIGLGTYAHSFANEIAFWVIPYLLLGIFVPISRVGFAISVATSGLFLGSILSALFPKFAGSLFVSIVVCMLSLLIVYKLYPKDENSS
jgi:MFS family permease